MTRFGLLGTSALRSAAFIGFTLAVAAPAYAQTTPAPKPPCPVNDPNCTDNARDTAQNPSSQPGDAPETDELDPQSEVELESGQTTTDGESSGPIVVTGSRIRRPNLESVVPITSVSQTELANQGQANIGDALNDLPSLRSTFSQQNSGQFIGTAGLNFLDLRGLGTTRTLVLVNNRRHVTASAGDFRIDVNTIPRDLTERVDIVTGGSSAVYGSDAIAGVVNFVLKRDFDGFRIRGQAGVSDEMDRGVQTVSATLGRNFAEGRGNVAVNFEIVNAEPLFFRDRDSQTGAFSGFCGFVPAENTAGEPAAGNGIPDNQFRCGLRGGSFSTGGTVGGIGGGRFLRFDRNGNLFTDIPTETFVNTNTQVGGTSNTFRETGQLAVGLDRYNANLLAHFDVSEAFRPFLEAKFVRLDIQQESGPSFIQGNTSAFFANNFGAAVPPIRCSNAFLSAQALATLRSFGLCANLATGTIGLQRNNIDFGTRGEDNQRDTYRIVAGFEGDFNDDWHYEVSGNYGKFKSLSNQKNNLVFADINGNPAGFALAIDAVRNSAGQIVCAVNADATTANDAPGCVPINLFGEGAPSQAALDFINTTSQLRERASQLDLIAFVNGDLSQLFELPGGPIAFVLGGEYRREKAFFAADPLSQSGATFFNAFDTFDPPTFNVKEVFGELSLPLLRDLPFARELTISGAARYSDYNTKADKTFAYNISGTFSPVSDIRFRANYSKSVRVPTLGDLFSPQTQNFGFITDPCNAINITAGPFRAANCAALGVPTTLRPGSELECGGTSATPPPVGRRPGDPFFNCRAALANTGFLSGGNPDLEEEVGKSLTIGGVLTPRFLPGFSLTVDYYDIKVKKLIAALSVNGIVTLCVDQPTINNQFCDALISPRDALGFFQNPVALSGGINFAAQRTRGLDFDAAYRRTFSNGYRLNLRGIATYVLERTDFTNPAIPDFGNRILSELGDPQFSAALITSLGIGNLDIQHSMRYIGKQTIGVFEAQNSFEGRPPTNADQFADIYYTDVFFHDLRTSYKVDDNFRAYFGVDNVLDRKPPLGLTGSGSGSAIFSSIGRYFYAGAQIDF